MKLRWFPVAAIAAGAILLDACGSTTPTTGATTSTEVVTTSATLTTTSSTIAENLTVTPLVRQGLLKAAAAFHQLPTSDFLGLRSGETFYAFDPTTKLYYAAAGLKANPNSLSAQVSTQDDGAYDLFTESPGAATWTVYSDGLGAAQDSTCPIAIPAAVLAAWNWKANSCYPPS